MLLMGDEVRRTQGGNNNAYCHDDATSWFDWSAAGPQCRHPALHQGHDPHAPPAGDACSASRPRRTSSTCSPTRRSNGAGSTVGQPDLSDASRSVALTLRAGPGALHIIFNAYWEPLDVRAAQARRVARGLAPHRRHEPRRPRRSGPHVQRGDARLDAGLSRRGAVDRGHRGTAPAQRQGKGARGMTGAERERMADAGHPENGWDEASPWYQWGPYLAERAWGSVREDYSADGDAWNSFPHDHARSRAYRWNEDGMAGISDVLGRMCLGLVAVERRRPDPQGADVRPDQRGGQSRRGRQGLLVVPRCPSERAPGCAGATTTRRRRSRTTDLIEENGAPLQVRARVRAARHGRLRRRPLLDRRGPLRQGGPDRHPDAGRRAQPGARRGDHPRPAHPVVPQRMVVEPGDGQADDAGRGR